MSVCFLKFFLSGQFYFLLLAHTVKVCDAVEHTDVCKWFIFAREEHLLHSVVAIPRCQQPTNYSLQHNCLFIITDSCVGQNAGLFTDLLFRCSASHPARHSHLAWTKIHSSTPHQIYRYGAWLLFLGSRLDNSKLFHAAVVLAFSWMVASLFVRHFVTSSGTLLAHLLT
jgi:hypothetical protein